MAKTPSTDPFYIGPLCGDWEDYVPVQEKCLSAVIFPDSVDLSNEDLIDEIEALLSSVSLSGGGGDMFGANNLSEITDAAAAATNLGLGAAGDVTHGSLTTTGTVAAEDGYFDGPAVDSNHVLWVGSLGNQNFTVDGFGNVEAKDIFPRAASSFSLGSAVRPWKDITASGTVTAESVTTTTDGDGLIIGGVKYTSAAAGDYARITIDGVQRMDVASNAVGISSGAKIVWNFANYSGLGGDLSLSRIASGELGVGTGANGSADGSLTTSSVTTSSIATASGSLNLNPANGEVGIGTFGDGFALSNAGDLRVSVSGIKRWQFNGVNFRTTSVGAGLTAYPSSTAPSIMPNWVDNNTGLGWTSADILHLITGGVAGLTVSASQNVGIGTTTPAEKLDVVGNIKTSGTVTASNFIDGLTSLGNVTTTSTLGDTGRNTATLTGETVFTMPDPTVISSTILYMTQDVTGGRDATFSGVLWPNGIVPDFTTSASSQVDVITFVSDGTSWYGMSVEAFS